MGAMGGGLLISQGSFRGRYDGLGSASNDDTNWIADQNADWSQVLDTNFRVRFGLYQPEHLGSVAGYIDVYYSHNGGPLTFADNSAEVWTEDSVVWCVDSDDAGYVEWDDTTEILTPVLPLGSFITPNTGIVASGWGTQNHTWPGSGGVGDTWNAEYEFCLRIRSEFVAPGDTIELFTHFTDINLEAFSGDGYVEWPTITVTEPVAAKALRIKGDALRLKGSSLIIK